MKAFLFTFVFMFVGVVQAETITCGKSRFAGDDQPETLTMTLASLGKTVNEVSEGVSVPYSLVLKDGDQVWLNLKVKASQEDVMFKFIHRSRDFGNIDGTIYMDELDQTALYVNGTRFSFDCGFED